MQVGSPETVLEPSSQEWAKLLPVVTEEDDVLCCGPALPASRRSLQRRLRASATAVAHASAQWQDSAVRPEKALPQPSSVPALVCSSGASSSSLALQALCWGSLLSPGAPQVLLLFRGLVASALV